MKRGEVWLAVLDPTLGSEIQKTRPCLIVSPDEMNAHLRTTTIVPLTSGGRPAPFRIPVTFKGKPGLLLPDQMRTLDRVRLVKRMGRVDAENLRLTLTVLREMFGE